LIATGEGATESGAITSAWHSAMLQYLKNTMSVNDFKADEKGIEHFLTENWRKYAVGDPEDPKKIKRYWNETITIQVRIKKHELLEDIEERFVQPRKKLKTVEVALISEIGKDKIAKGEWLDRDAMFDTLQDCLGTYLKVHSLRDIQELIQEEAKTLGIPRDADPKMYVAAKFSQVKIVIYVWVTTQSKYDPLLEGELWFATIGCRIVDLETKQEVKHFQIRSGEDGSKPMSAHIIGDREARALAIKNVAKVAAKKIIQELSNR
jgi:hypothetical protein